MNFNIPVGEHIIQLNSIDSTNNYLSKLINETDVPNGTVILAQSQTKGRGQRGNSWVSEENKNIACSYYIKLNKLLIEDVFLLSMAIANAIHKYVNNHFENGLIKWPNDILIGNNKVCGVLIENSISGKYISQSIVGIGININQSDFPEEIKATSFKLASNTEWDLKNAFMELNILINKEINLLNSGLITGIRNYYLNNLIGYGVNRNYTDLTNNTILFTGKIVDVENNGLLIIETNTGTKKFNFKEIGFIL